MLGRAALVLGCVALQQHLSQQAAQQQGHLQNTQRVLTGEKVM